jgi:ABC-type transporter Mla MlaB component
VTSSEPTVGFVIRGPIERSDLPGLCRRVCSLLEQTGSQIVPCDVTGVEVNAVCVDALARLSLAARRRGCLIRLEGVSPELAELLAFMGLEQVLVPKPDRHAGESG